MVEYISNDRRVIEFSFDLAVKATRKYVGGGFVVQSKEETVNSLIEE